MQEHLSPSAPIPPPAAAASHAAPIPEGCPTPLAWQEVLASVERDGRASEFVDDDAVVRQIVLGDGPPLWFLNGFTGDSRLYALLAWLLRDRFECRLVDIDWRAAPPAPAALTDGLADALTGAMRAAGGGPPILYGADYGACLAIAIAARSQDAVRAMILQGGFLRLRDSWTERLLAAIGRRVRRPTGTLAAWRTIQESNHRHWFPPMDPTRWEFLMQNRGATSVADLSRRLRAASAIDLRPRLSQVRAPALVLRTEGDGRVRSSAQDELVERLPRVSEEMLHTTGHFAFLTHPHRVAKLVRAFADSLLPSPATPPAP
ncbi:MAG: alpha/beta hydrolase [Planctomyces sp.]|nr:alpha/beta hydrolase [Planctomyces sp.]